MEVRPITEEELLEAIETGESDRFDLNSVGVGDNFRGYVIKDKETDVRVADYIYSHTRKGFDLRIRPGCEREIALAMDNKRDFIQAPEEIMSNGVSILLEGGKKMSNMALNRIETSDYNLCVKYIDHALNYIDDLLATTAAEPQATAMLNSKKEELRTGYANAARAAYNDVSDYLAMGEDFKDIAKEAEERLRVCTREFEDEFLTMFPGGPSFARSNIFDEEKSNAFKGM